MHSLVPHYMTAPGPNSTVRSAGTPRLSLSHRHGVTQLAVSLGILVTEAGIYLIRLVLLKLPEH